MAISETYKAIQLGKHCRRPRSEENCCNNALKSAAREFLHCPRHRYCSLSTWDGSALRIYTDRKFAISLLPHFVLCYPYVLHGGGGRACGRARSVVASPRLFGGGGVALLKKKTAPLSFSSPLNKERRRRMPSPTGSLTRLKCLLSFEFSLSPSFSVCRGFFTCATQN